MYANHRSGFKHPSVPASASQVPHYDESDYVDQQYNGYADEPAVRVQRHRPRSRNPRLPMERKASIPSISASKFMVPRLPSTSYPASPEKTS